MDNGGPSREFWRLFVVEVVREYCGGKLGNSIFARNIPVVQVRGVCFACMPTLMQSRGLSFFLLWTVQ